MKRPYAVECDKTGTSTGVWDSYRRLGRIFGEARSGIESLCCLARNDRTTADMVRLLSQVEAGRITQRVVRIDDADRPLRELR